MAETHHKLAAMCRHPLIRALETDEAGAALLAHGRQLVDSLVGYVPAEVHKWQHAPDTTVQFGWVMYHGSKRLVLPSTGTLPDYIALSVWTGGFERDTILVLLAGTYLDWAATVSAFMLPPELDEAVDRWRQSVGEVIAAIQDPQN